MPIAIPKLKTIGMIFFNILPSPPSIPVVDIPRRMLPGAIAEPIAPPKVCSERIITGDISNSSAAVI